MISALCRRLSAVLLTLSAAPAFADDGFMAIHMANQKVGSPVAEVWAGLLRPRANAPDGFMSIHMANQRLGSPVANFWLAQSKPNAPAIDIAQNGH